ncbi:hypothetical protein NUW58_g1079 [Xylaria curta]|uniref:Uncharacterized protein n=1 Tax=Xylaria curta TaxID=42375 RepID=A0ACC1PPI7_9PEZI|nr:hypothetical protein NUW58_g1079 [Xylaria curta]
MAPSVETLEEYLKEATSQLYDADPNTVTVNSARQHAEEQNDLPKGFFVTPDWKARSKTVITEFVQTLLANDSPSSIVEPKVEQDIKHGVKRSSSDDLSSSPVAKRHKKATSTAASRNTKLKKESSSSALSELSDSDTKPKKQKNKKTTTKKTSRPKQESESELSDLNLSEDEPEPKQSATKPTSSRKSKKEESESELSDLSSSEDKPKLTKKRGRKPTKLEDSDDGGNVINAKVLKSRLKRKQPKTTKRTAKRVKAESDSEGGADVGSKVEKNEVDGDVKIDVATKDEDSDEDVKPEVKESKPPADHSDSSLSSVLDEPPPRKRKGKDAKEPPKPKQSTSKEPTGDEVEIKKLQGQLVKCGVRKIWGIELKKYGSDSKAKIRHLKALLRDVGMDGRFSEAKAREIKERRELMGELEAVNEMNELWGLEGRKGRASRSKVVRKSLKEESDDDGDDDGEEQKPKVEDDDEDVKVQTNSRMSKRMADLAFLGSDSESE